MMGNELLNCVLGVLDFKELAISLLTSTNIATLVSSISAATAVVAVIVAWWLNHKQRDLQLRLTLFDKRFAVYRSTEEFIYVVLRTDGFFNLLDDLPKFQEAIEEAQFLFPDDSGVMAYLERSPFVVPSSELVSGNC